MRRMYVLLIREGRAERSDKVNEIIVSSFVVFWYLGVLGRDGERASPGSLIH